MMMKLIVTKKLLATLGRVALGLFMVLGVGCLSNPTPHPGQTDPGVSEPPAVPGSGWPTSGAANDPNAAGEARASMDGVDAAAAGDAIKATDVTDGPDAAHGADAGSGSSTGDTAGD